MNKFLIALTALLCGGNLAADVQINIRDVAGGNSIISSDGQRVRIDSGKMPGYVLIDYSQGQILMVDTARRQVMRSSVGADAATAGGVEVRLRDKGGGQKIAGYLTRKFQITSGAEDCGTVYASKKLLANPAVRGMFEGMRQLQRSGRSMAAGLGGLFSNCQRAHMQLSEVLEAAGAPLKIIDQSGGAVSEVTAVDTAKNLPRNYYQIPAGLPVVDTTQMMNQAREQTQQLLQQMPDMDELMQQMQKSGGQAGEDMQQQLNQLQQMLQQQMQQQ